VRRQTKPFINNLFGLRLLQTPIDNLSLPEDQHLNLILSFAEDKISVITIVSLPKGSSTLIKLPTFMSFIIQSSPNQDNDYSTTPSIVSQTGQVRGNHSANNNYLPAK